MRKRMLISIAIVFVLAVVVAPVYRAYALQAHIEKMKSACDSIQARISLIYNQDDTGNEEYRGGQVDRAEMSEPIMLEGVRRIVHR